MSAGFFNVQRWTEMPRGGHFAAMEEPEPLAEDIRIWFRAFRGRPSRGQAGSFHHRIRCFEDAVEKRIYMDENPVRAGLVRRIRDWPYRGELRKTERWWF
jgi:hypothetical protein